MKLATSTATLLATALLALPLAGETGVFFTPMLTAYEQGRVDDARQLAEGYLNVRAATCSRPRFNRIRTARCAGRSRWSKASWTTKARSILCCGSHGGRGLTVLSQEVLDTAQDTARRSTRATPAEAKYYQTHLGQAARSWIAAAGPTVARDQVQRMADRLEPQLREIGVAPGDIDAVLRNGARAMPRNRGAVAPPRTPEFRRPMAMRFSPRLASISTQWLRAMCRSSRLRPG